MKIFIKLNNIVVQNKLIEYFQKDFQIKPLDESIGELDIKDLVIIEEDLITDNVNPKSTILLVKNQTLQNVKNNKFFQVITLPLEIEELTQSMKDFFNKNDNVKNINNYFLSSFSNGGSIEKGGIRVALSHKEVLILSILFDNYPQKIDRKLFLEKVWGFNHDDIQTHVLESFIFNIRKKLAIFEETILIKKDKQGYLLFFEE